MQPVQNTRSRTFFSLLLLLLLLLQVKLVSDPFAIAVCSCTSCSCFSCHLRSMVFVLSKVEDVIELAPDTSSTDTAVALTSAINAKYANRVIMDVGLCICLFDLLSQTDGIVKPGNGSAYITVVFRIIVFRPFLGEVLVGKIASQDVTGLKITLGFFDDIHISHPHLPEGSTFDGEENTWVWETDGNKLYLDNDEQIRFKVEHEQFVDCTPDKRNAPQTSQTPYALQASAATPGLGLITWWED